ncbi:MAG: hypothetical protein NTU83_12455 [Candidatus Hydrogenedentes bacterium]|nr:hypothetical protein [Candidatus Hydrogenedentota bacterium]
MKKIRIYLDTSVISFLLADDAGPQPVLKALPRLLLVAQGVHPQPLLAQRQLLTDLFADYLRYSA